ncbi:MAG: hypothetical protein WAO55_01225 [Candidatus Manganitrophaceae bacterium]
MMEVSRETHLKLAFFLWAVVGTGLLLAGGFFLFGQRSMSELDNRFGSGGPGIAEGIGFVIALAIGFAKGSFVLPKVARKNIARIEQLPERSPFYMTFSLKSWLLILLMILIGRMIRFLGAPRLVIGVIYVAVGLALALGSRIYLMAEPEVPGKKVAS